MFRDRRLTWAELTEHTDRLAGYLLAHGLGCHTERADLQGHESGQDHLAIYLHNGVEYLEVMLGCWKARVAPFNVNYRYVAEELQYLLVDSGATAIVVHSRFAPTLAEVLPQLPALRVIIQVPDDSGHDLLPGAVWFDEALAAAPPGRPAPSPAVPTTSTSSTPVGPRACPRASCGATGTPWSSASAAPRQPARSTTSWPRPTAG